MTRADLMFGVIFIAWSMGCYAMGYREAQLNERAMQRKREGTPR